MDTQEGIVELGGGTGGVGGSGDVTGPASATDNAIARFNGTGGKTLQNSPAIVEDDGQIYSSTNSGANEGVVGLKHWIRISADYTLANDTSQQKLFNSPTNGALTLPTGVYLVRGLVLITAMSATSGNVTFSLLGAGTATLASPLFQTVGIDNTTPSSTASQTGQTVQAAVTSGGVAVAGTGTAVAFQVTGIIRVTAAGTVIPSVTQPNAAAAVVEEGSFLVFERIGDAGDVSVGAWT